MDSQTRRAYRSIAHHLKPVVRLGERGLTDAVIAEADRALSDHELIKVRVNGDRETRAEQATDLAQALEAERVQSIGHTLVLYRHNPKADPKLSNIARLGGAARERR